MCSKKQNAKEKEKKKTNENLLRKEFYLYYDFSNLVVVSDPCGVGNGKINNQ